MLENATVNISLEDLDHFRECKKELETIKSLISFATESNTEEIDQGKTEKVVLRTSKKALEKLIYDYHAWNKSKDEWITECNSIDEIEIKIE